MTDEIPAELAEVLRELAKCIQGLGPYQKDAVLSGGLVPVLYRRVLECAPSRLPPRTTFDLDWTLPSQLPLRGELLHQRMIRLGFVARKSGSGKMPVTHYQPSGGAYEQPSPIYVEFLAPRVGGKHTRKGSNQGVIEVQSCLHAQTDPYLGLLFVDLLNVSAAEIPELALSSEHQLRLPNPMSFILQKTLIRSNRRRSKQEADLCHIYDVVTLTHDMWAEMRDVLKRLNEDAGFPRKWIPSARTILDKLFSTPTSPGPLAVSSNYHGLVSEKEAVLVMSRFFLECW